jgi:hypothetical protein
MDSLSPAIDLLQEQQKSNILYLVDGKPMKAKDVDKIDMADIEQLEYIKEKDRIRQYTEDETVGTVVLITLKNSTKQEQEEEGETEP